jgi:hypothetical protein
MDFGMIRIVLVFFFSWAGFSPFMIYVTNFFGQNVYHGNSSTDVERFRYGVKIGMYALAIFAAVQLVYSLIMPEIIKRIGIKLSYFFSQIIAGTCLLLFIWFHDPIVAIVLTACVAINFTSFNSIPFGLGENYFLYL